MLPNTIKTSPLYLTRFIAAYLVLMVHYSPPVLRAQLPSIKNFGEPVNYFFFISGFVMIVSVKNYLGNAAEFGSFSKLAFWMKRIARIYPLYIGALLLLVLFNFSVTEIHPSIWRHVWLEAIGLNRWFCIDSINFPGWTISCELFFYCLFPFALSLLVKKGFKKFALWTLVLYAANLLLTFFYRKYTLPLSELSGAVAYKMLVYAVLKHPVFRFAIFLLGCLCGYFYVFSAKMLVIVRYNFLLFAISLFAIVCFYKYTMVDGALLEAGILCIAYIPFVLSLCSFRGKVLGFLSWRPFIFLGEISYGLYIMQAPVAHYFEYFFTKNKPFQTDAQFFLYSLFLIACCSVFYYVVEIPAKRIILKWGLMRQELLLAPTIV